MVTFRDATTQRIGIIALLTLGLLIPTLMVQALIADRADRKREAMKEISSQWGGIQTLVGPVLTIPYRHTDKDAKGQLINSIRAAHFLPDHLSFEAAVVPEIRHRGIYEFVLYTTTIAVRGQFSYPRINAFNFSEEAMVRQDVVLNMGIAAMQGVRDQVAVKWGTTKLAVEAGVTHQDLFKSGFHARPDLDPEVAHYPFEFEISLNGTESLMFVPVGRETTTRVTSTWPSPSFTGHFLPMTRQVEASGFNANWKIFHLNRNFPQSWSGAAPLRVEDADYGVKLLMPVDGYKKTERTVKYAILLIILTFVTFFVIELLHRLRVHLFQYLLIGLSIVLYYAMLLAFSEHLPFDVAYLLASGLVVIQVALYTRTVLAGSRFAMSVAALLSLFHGFIFTLLQREDHALLLGTLGLFVTLGAIMAATRNIDWYPKES